MKFAGIKTHFRALTGSTLVMNAFYLMLSTLVVAVAGFIFWIAVARSYDTAAVGLATTLISVSVLSSLLGLAGFDSTFVRFLPRSDQKNEYINSGFMVVTLASTVLAVSLATILPMVSSSMSILDKPWAFVSFVFFTVVTSLNVLTNAVFLAFKEAKYILIINAIFSLLKILLPLLVAAGGAITIFVLAGSAQLLGLVLSVAWMRHRFGYRFSPRIHAEALRAVRKFSVSMYASSILNLLPTALLPLIIVNRMGPKNAAYYYMAFTIVGVLYTIAYASMQSVFAEGSHDEAAMNLHVAKASKMIAVMLLPAAAITIALSHILLTMFGQEYAARSSSLLQLFALSALPVAIYSALGAIFKVTKNLAGMVTMNVAYAAVIIGLSYVLIPRWGLIATGWAWAAGNLAACGVGVLFLTRINKYRRHKHGTAT